MENDNKIVELENTIKDLKQRIAKLEDELLTHKKMPAEIWKNFYLMNFEALTDSCDKKELKNKNYLGETWILKQKKLLCMA